MEKGIAKVPDNVRVRGADGQERHGDSAIACALVIYAAKVMEGYEIDWTPAPDKARAWDGKPDDDKDDDDIGRAAVGGGAW